MLVVNTPQNPLYHPYDLKKYNIEGLMHCCSWIRQKIHCIIGRIKKNRGFDTLLVVNTPQNPLYHRYDKKKRLFWLVYLLVCSLFLYHEILRNELFHCVNHNYLNLGYYFGGIVLINAVWMMTRRRECDGVF